MNKQFCWLLKNPLSILKWDILIIYITLFWLWELYKWVRKKKKVMSARIFYSKVCYAIKTISQLEEYCFKI